MRVLLAVLVLACAYPAAAATAPPRTSDGMSCDSPGQSQAGLNQCASNGAKAADAELNRVYAKVLAANAQNTVFLEKFKAAQRAWVAFRDAQIAARYPTRRTTAASFQCARAMSTSS
jgi:uncharacterized protein YecT (DUF1311 family)